MENNHLLYLKTPKLSIMKYIKTFALIFFCISFTSCIQKNNLSAEIVGLGNDTIYIESYKISNIEEDPIIDTIYSKNGKFFYDLPVKEAIISIVTPRKAEYTRLDKSPYRPLEKSILLILKPEDRISVKGKLEKLNLKYQAKGSEINEEYSDNRNEYVASLIEKSKIELEIDSLMFNNGDRETINALFKKRKEYSIIASNFQLNYINNNLDKNLSAYYLSRQPLDTIGKYLKKLDKFVKEGTFENLLKFQFTRFQKYTKVREAESRIKLGGKAPEFSLKSINEEHYSVDFSKNKFTILDFWGSWCAPCISGFPKMKKHFEKYKNRIEFIGIACNDTETKWRNAVNEHELKWKNLFNDNEIDKDVSVKYAIKGYPTKIIINSSGIIEGIFNGEGEYFYNRLDELMKN
ncbi:redoxin domain-containing protein [Polaribacter batillariae]|uniref:Redoxin domain-containing protein n=1 Tax=Polaribacter batillariae TaxID=2808900 RepID=A0ABX7SY86_9FLAO|nr:thioredoxin-like domain-containing protein [Polaribacter batillariae]QTD37951.1 redoxin domain-containing protein [Polaribacter batillariae]